MRIPTRFLLLALTLGVFTLSSTSSFAAPQVLGLIASAEPIPLTCEDGMCSAEISSTCLQKSRSAPVLGTAYKPAKDTQITLVVTDASGAQKTLPVAKHVEINSFSMYHSVVIRVPEKFVTGPGNGKASLSVGRLASAIPVAIKGDPRPFNRARNSTLYWAFACSCGCGL
jgi:hypothetical protein